MSPSELLWSYLIKLLSIIVPVSIAKAVYLMFHFDRIYNHTWDMAFTVPEAGPDLFFSPRVYPIERVSVTLETDRCPRSHQTNSHMSAYLISFPATAASKRDSAQKLSSAV